MTNWFAGDSLWGDALAERNAGNKARRDVEVILKDLGWKRLPVAVGEAHESEANSFSKLMMHRSIESMWLKAIGKLQADDVLLFQIPLVNHTVFFNRILKECAKKKVKTIGLIHDLEILRSINDKGQSLMARMRIEREEKTPLVLFDAVIAHNASMKQALVNDLGLSAERVIVLGIFDYLVDDEISISRFSQGKPFVICGSLRREKAGYLSSLPNSMSFWLYGIGFEGSANDGVVWKGSFDPEELIDAIDGSFGLVWDGPSAECCCGVYGNYLRINNPHKASMYLAAGLPIAIWDEAALASFIIDRGVGISASSIQELGEISSDMNIVEYEALKKNAAGLAQKLRNGFFTRQAALSAVALVR